jgi:hypothetical protein
MKMYLGESVLNRREGVRLRPGREMYPLSYTEVI